MLQRRDNGRGQLPAGQYDISLYSVYMALMEEDVPRPVYRLYGDAVGYGWNGEPLVKVEKVERLTGEDLGSLETAREGAVKDMIVKFLM